MRFVEAIQSFCRTYELFFLNILDKLRALHSRQVALTETYEAGVSLVPKRLHVVGDLAGGDFLPDLPLGEEFDDVLPTFETKDCVGVGRIDERTASFFFSFGFSGVSEVLEAV